MKVAYVDSSWLVAIAFAEPGFKRKAQTLARYDVALSSGLLEAELRSALRRENIETDPDELLSVIDWVHPDRRLTVEIAAVLDAGYLRGPDLWHLATALFVDPLRELDFLTLDVKQAEVAKALRFGHP